MFRKSTFRSLAALLAAAPLALLPAAATAQPAPAPKAPVAPKAPPAPVPPAPKTAPKTTRVTTMNVGGDCSGHGFVSSRRAYLGVEATPITPELRRHFGAPDGSGVLVSRVIDGGPAARAGIVVGDILTRCGNAGVREPRDLRGAVAGRKGGESLNVEIFRGGQRREMTLKLEEKESCSFDIGEVIDAGDMEELSRLGDLDISKLERLGDLDFDLDIDLDLGSLNSIVDSALKMAAVGMEHALESGELQRHLAALEDGRMEAIEQKMREVSRELDRLDRKLKSETGAHADQARAEIDRARQELLRDLERSKKEIERDVQRGLEEARRGAEEARRQVEKAKKEAIDATVKGKGGGGELF